MSSKTKRKERTLEQMTSDGRTREDITFHLKEAKKHYDSESDKWRLSWYRREITSNFEEAIRISKELNLKGRLKNITLEYVGLLDRMNEKSKAARFANEAGLAELAFKYYFQSQDPTELAEAAFSMRNALGLEKAKPYYKKIIDIPRMSYSPMLEMKIMLAKEAGFKDDESRLNNELKEHFIKYKKFNLLGLWAENQGMFDFALECYGKHKYGDITWQVDMSLVNAARLAKRMGHEDKAKRFISTLIRLYSKQFPSTVARIVEAEGMANLAIRLYCGCNNYISATEAARKIGRHKQAERIFKRGIYNTLNITNNYEEAYMKAKYAKMDAFAEELVKKGVDYFKKRYENKRLADFLEAIRKMDITPPVS